MHIWWFWVIVCVFFKLYENVSLLDVKFWRSFLGALTIVGTYEMV